MTSPMRAPNTMGFKRRSKSVNFSGKEDSRNDAISRRQANLGGYGQRGQIANPNDPNRRRFDVLSKLDDENWKSWDAARNKGVGETFKTKYVTGGRADGFQPSDFGEGHRGAGIPYQIKEFDAQYGKELPPMLPPRPKGVESPIPRDILEQAIRRRIGGV